MGRAPAIGDFTNLFSHPHSADLHKVNTNLLHPLYSYKQHLYSIKAWKEKFPFWFYCKQLSKKTIATYADGTYLFCLNTLYQKFTPAK